MKTNHTTKETTVRAHGQAAVATGTEVFLGIDAAKRYQAVAKFVPGEGVKPGEKMLAETLLKRATALVKAGVQVHCVYEAGPTGFALARQLIATGASCLVVRPKRLNRYGRRRKNDPKDAQYLAEDLAAHHHGRQGLLCPVRLPSVEEELRRLPVRERGTLHKARRQLLNSAKGRALALGYTLPREWWRPRVLPTLVKPLPGPLAALLQRAAAAAATLAEQIDAVEADLTSEPIPAPQGVGALTVAVLEREVCAWDRFQNHRQVGSFAGLCPSEDSTGEKFHQGGIDKHGNPRLRFWCQELSWRLLKWQPNYVAAIWARERMREANAKRCKQLSVALARRFLVDWWRVRTGRTTCAELGLTFKQAG
jgi:transposase